MQMLLSKRHEIREIAVVIKKKYGIAEHIQCFVCIEDIYSDCNNECLQ